MKKSRKLISLLMALAMIFALAIPAFATGETITVTNANIGETYEAYLVFTATTNGTSNTYYITSTSPYFNYIDPSQANDSPFTLVATGTEGKYQVTFTDGEAAAAYIVSIGKQGAAVATVTAGSETTVLTVNQPGYYFVTTTTGTAVSTSATTGNANITDKNKEPTVDKDVVEDSTNTSGDSNTAGIGDVVEYSVTISDAGDVDTLVYHDIMSTGLTFDSTSVVVKVGETELTAETDYTVETEGLNDGCTFEVIFTEEGLKKVTGSVTITYSATVNENAEETNGNTGKVTYGDAGESQSSSTTTKVYDFDLTKVDGEGKSLTASFTLADSDGELISFVKVNGGYRVATKTEEETTTTIEAGTVNIFGLDAGEYTLTETAAPDGYNQLTSSVTIVIDANGNVTVSGNTLASGTDNSDDVTVVNESGVELPSTGGMGTTLFYIFGGAMVLCAVVLLVTRRRMDNEQ